MLETYLRTARAKKVMLALLAVIAPLFFWGGPNEYSSALFKALWDCGHLGFFVIFVAFLDTRVKLDNWRPAVYLSLTVFVVGGLIEIIQAHTGRDGNWGDLLRDLVGTWLGLFWFQRANRWIWYGRIISVVLVLPSLFTVFFAAAFQLHTQLQFPVIANFESPIDIYGHRDHVARSPDFASQGNYSLKISLEQNKPYSGITFDRLYPDWSGYKHLTFDIYNPEASAFTMSLRINDAQHQINGWHDMDRYNARFVVNPGWNHLVFSLKEVQQGPAHRQMEMTAITHLVIFASQIPTAQYIYLDNVHLE